MSSELGVTNEKINALAEYATSALYSDAERVALEYADCMTITGLDASDELFERLRRFYDDDAIVELTAIIAWENASSKFNRALRVPSQKLWKRSPTTEETRPVEERQIKDGKFRDDRENKSQATSETRKL